MDTNFTNFENKRILVRKKLAGFIEKLFNYLGYKLNHDRVKKVLYGEESFKSDDEERIKRTYDAYIYLLLNAKNSLTSKILNTFFYIFSTKEIDSNVSLRIATKNFEYIDKPVIESAVDFHIDVFNQLECACEEDKLIVSLIFFNYFIVKNGIPAIVFLPSSIKEYLELKKEYIKGNKLTFYRFFFELINNEKMQDKSYYENLKELTLKDVYKVLKEDEEQIKEKFSIKHLSIFGSFAKQINRIDSDIDLLASFSLDLTSDEKIEKVDQMKTYYFNKFNRFIDISEISEYLDDEFIREIPYVKKVF